MTEQEKIKILDYYSELFNDEPLTIIDWEQFITDVKEDLEIDLSEEDLEKAYKLVDNLGSDFFNEALKKEIAQMKSYIAKYISRRQYLTDNDDIVILLRDLADSYLV